MSESQAATEGRAVKEVLHMEGWSIIKNRIDARVADAVEELRNMEIEGRSLQDIGAEAVSAIKLIEGLRTVETEINIIIEAYDREVNQ